MKTFFHLFRTVFFISASFLILFAIGCKKKNSDADVSSKTPIWIYNTNENSYQSKPCLSGDKVIVCSYDDNDANLHTTHCINRNTGTSVWKYNDSVTGRISPVVYNNLVILGGMNPHALNLSDGSFAWKYADDLIPHALYSNPLLADNSVYFASYISLTKHAASSGALLWEKEGNYVNLRNSRPVINNGKLYYGDIANNMTSFIESDGQIEWSMTFEGVFANIPAVTDSEIFIGIHDDNINTKTLRCINLNDRTEKWGVKLGRIDADIAIAGDKVYAIGLQTLHCRSAIDGSAIWQYDMTAGSVCEPLITGDKVIIGNGDGLFCLNASTGALIWKYVTTGSNPNGFSSSTLDGDRIYVSCDDGNVYCFSIN